MDFYAGGPTGAPLGSGPILPGMGPGARVGAGPGPGPGLSPAVRGERGVGRGVVGIVPREDGSEEAKVFLVAVEGQDVAGVVRRLLVLVRMALALHGVRGRAKERRHPVAVLISVEEGEVEGLSPVVAEGFRIIKWTKYW